MNKTHQPLENLSPDEQRLIQSLLNASNVGLEERCAQYRRRSTCFRYVLTAFLFIATTYESILFIPNAQYTQITSNHKVKKASVTHTITQLLDLI